MENDNNVTRREFLGDVLKTGSVAAVGGLTCLGFSGKAGGADNAADLITGIKIDPDMILYDEIGKPVPSGFTESRSLTVDSAGVLYAAGDKAVRIFDSRGRIRETVNLTVSPFCLAATDKQFYIGTKDRIVIIGRNGKVQTSWKSLGENAWITSIALADEHVYIADAGQRIVWCYDLMGKFIRRIGVKNPEKNIPGFVVPGPYFDLAMAPDGLLRVANPGRHQIEAYTVKGDREFAWGRFGNRLEDFTACCNPVSFTILPDGNLITCEKGAARVKVYDTFGKLKGFVAEPKQLANISPSIGVKQERVQRYGFDVAADRDGQVYILDRARNAIRIFKRKDI
ncbi:hypothetical protein ACFL6W_06530 [Thermodesulfobacteriota bacterium]